MKTRPPKSKEEFQRLGPALKNAWQSFLQGRRKADGAVVNAKGKATTGSERLRSTGLSKGGSGPAPASVVSEQFPVFAGHYAACDSTASGSGAKDTFCAWETLCSRRRWP